MRLNRTVLAVGLLVIATLSVLPPWAKEVRKPLSGIPLWTESAGYAPIWSPPSWSPPQETQSSDKGISAPICYQLDLPRLTVQLFAVASLTLALSIMLRPKKPDNPLTD